MKLEEKIKDKYLYSYGLNIFKFLYFNFQYLKAKFKPRIINANWALDLIVDNIFRKKKGGIYIDEIRGKNSRQISLLLWFEYI